MKTYAFKVVVEPDEGGYHAYCPALRRFGAVTQGATPSEALKNINEVVQMIMDELHEDGVALPTNDDDVEIFEGTRVAVTVRRDLSRSISRKFGHSLPTKLFVLFSPMDSSYAREAGATIAVISMQTDAGSR